MDFKSIQKKCLNNNSNTFCDKSHYIKYQKNKDETFFIISFKDIVSSTNQVKLSNVKHQSRLKVLQKLYIINNVIFRPNWLKPFSNL